MNKFFTEISKPTVPELASLIDPATQRIKLVIGVTIGELASSSGDNSIEGLNDLVDEIIDGGTSVYAITYRLVGTFNDLVLIEVDADTSDLQDDLFSDFNIEDEDEDETDDDDQFSAFRNF